MIVGYTGLVGMGKTMLGVREAVELARLRDAVLVSNIRVHGGGVEVRRLEVGDDGLEGLAEILQEARACEVCQEVDEWGDVVHRGWRVDGCTQRGVVIFVDEIGIVLPARFWERGMSIDLMWACSQSRKLGADLIFTCQHVAQLDAYLRRITDWVWRVKAIPHPTISRREAGKRPWLYLVGRWRPADIDTERPEKRLSRKVVRYQRAWEGLYNTDELVRPPSALRSGGRRRRSPSPIKAGLDGHLPGVVTRKGRSVAEDPRSGLTTPQGPSGDVVAVPVPLAAGGGTP